MSNSQSGKGKEKKKKAEKQTENMYNEEEDEQVLPANAVVASNADQLSWVSELQASFHAGMDKIHAKIDKGQSTIDAKLDKIGKKMEMKQGLDSLREETKTKFESVDVDMQAQKKEIDTLEERTVEVEEWTTEVQDILTASLDQQTKLQEKLSDLEGRSRRSNIRIWGLKEGVEGDSVDEYVDKLINKELGMSEDIKLDIQRANRALAPKPQPNKPPTATIVNFLRFEVKENVLKTAWRSQLEVECHRVTFDHDYAAEVAAKRRR